MKVIGTKMTITKKKLHKIMRWFSSASLMHRQLKVDAPYSTSRNTGRTHTHTHTHTGANGVWWCLHECERHTLTHTYMRPHLYIYCVYYIYIYICVCVYHISVFVNVPKYSILQTQIRASNHHPLFTTWLTLADNTLGVASENIQPATCFFKPANCL